MKEPSIIETHKPKTDRNDQQPKTRRRAGAFARATVAAVVAGGSIAGLSACSSEPNEKQEQEQGTVQVLAPEYKVGEVMLEADLAQSRQNVLELCNTGEGAAEVRQEWTDFGYEERSGMEWIDAVKYLGDFKYMSNPNAIVDYGSYTYPTAEALATNCLDAAFLLSQSPTDVAYLETAAPLLEKFHNEDGSDPVIPLQRIYDNIKFGEEAPVAQG
ncbi:MAG: hypothetical protein WAR37_02405 [Candidatus Microsaccharimonas sp.]